jgi:hypothetical protein
VETYGEAAAGIEHEAIQLATEEHGDVDVGGLQGFFRKDVKL